MSEQLELASPGRDDTANRCTGRRGPHGRARASGRLGAGPTTGPAGNCTGRRRRPPAGHPSRQGPGDRSGAEGRRTRRVGAPASAGTSGQAGSRHHSAGVGRRTWPGGIDGGERVANTATTVPAAAAASDGLADGAGGRCHAGRTFSPQRTRTRSRRRRWSRSARGTLTRNPGPVAAGKRNRSADTAWSVAATQSCLASRGA